MTLPSPIVAYQKRAPDHSDPFGTWCKLHHAFFTHLAEARLSGAAYKVVLQVLCASFHFGQYHPATLSLDQFQRSQHLGRKAVIEELRQAVARGILYEERGWQTGAHAPKQYGLVFYCALVADRDNGDDSARRQGMTLLKGGARPYSKPVAEPADASSSKARSSSMSEPHLETEEDLRTPTGAEIEPAAGGQRVPTVAAGAEIEPAPVREPHHPQFANRTTAGAFTEPEAAQQRRQEAASDIAQEKAERRDSYRIQATLAPPPEAAAKEQADSEEEDAVPFPQPLSPAGVAVPHDLAPSDHLTTKIAALREDYQRRQAELEAWRPHGVEQIQAKIAARLEARRLEHQIEELETALALQDQRTREVEDTSVAGEPDKACVSAARDGSTLEPAPALPLHVAEEQLALWRADVVAQRREVMRIKTQYQAVTEQLQQCRIGRGNWGALVREQRFLAGELAEQETQLARYERFVALIEGGATKEEACKQLLERHHQETSADQSATEELPPAAIPAEDQLPAEPALRLEGQKLRQALFTALAQMFTTGDPNHIALERGKFNRAIKNLVAVDVQPEDLPVLQATFRRLWPKATCTALGLANNLPMLIDKAQMFGWQLRSLG
jgi:hypothetical protein